MLAIILSALALTSYALIWLLVMSKAERVMITGWIRNVRSRGPRGGVAQ
jgi:hypothetical protein